MNIRLVPRPTTVYLVRHGESQLNLAKRVSGQLDTSLSPKGHYFSQGLAEQLCAMQFTSIYTSALSGIMRTWIAIQGVKPW